MTVVNPTITKAPAQKRRGTAAGRDLIAAMKEVHRAVTTGDYTGMTIREVEIPEPRAFSAAEVRAVRKMLGASIAVFAKLCGVSSKLVEHWEQSRRLPSPLACRLLERIEADPAAYVGLLVQSREVQKGDVRSSS
jgi:DNA-binding transcriptional regulator YiaG